MDFETAILLECQCVHWFELSMKDAACGVRPLERRPGRAKGGFDPGVVNHECTTAWCGDLPGSVVDDFLLGHLRSITCSPIDLHKIGCPNRGGIRRCAYEDPSGHRVGGVLQHEARKIALDPLCRGIVDRAD